MSDEFSVGYKADAQAWLRETTDQRYWAIQDKAYLMKARHRYSRNQLCERIRFIDPKAEFFTLDWNTAIRRQVVCPSRTTLDLFVQISDDETETSILTWLQHPSLVYGIKTVDDCLLERRIALKDRPHRTQSILDSETPPPANQIETPKHKPYLSQSWLLPKMPLPPHLQQSIRKNETT